MKLYKVTGNEKYMHLCHFFLAVRGEQPYFYDIEMEKRGGPEHWAITG